MLKIGLTGSIAVGKSFVCQVLREAGCPMLDSDISARQVVAAGSDGLAEIVRCFGENILTAVGELDRKKMGAIIFADEEKRKLLNAIVHPRVFVANRNWLIEREAEDPDGIAVIDAALMIESGSCKQFDKIIVVWCEPAIQLQRLMLRDNLGEADARQRILAQMPQGEKKLFADHLIDTSGGFEDTRRQTLDLLRTLRRQPA
jgi:dephospho-CoA kinase